jgi:hypothetical protein
MALKRKQNVQNLPNNSKTDEFHVVDPKLGGDARRKALYDDLQFVYSPTPSSLALCELAQSFFSPRIRCCAEI